MEDRGLGRGLQPGQVSQGARLLPSSHPKLTPERWGRGTCTHARSTLPQRHHPFSSHRLLTAGDIQVVQPTVPGLVLVGEAAGRRGSLGLVVFDFGLDVFCHVSDS